MGYIRERSLSDGRKRFYAEVELKGAGPRLTATFNRKTMQSFGFRKLKYRSDNPSIGHTNNRLNR